jgi:hypothetical protein
MRVATHNVDLCIGDISPARQDTLGRRNPLMEPIGSVVAVSPLAADKNLQSRAGCLTSLAAH